jgi:aminopeptidase
MTQTDRYTGQISEQLDRYADLLVTHGANIQPGQLLQLGAEAAVRDFAVRVVDAAYRRGAGYVHLELIEPRAARSRFLHASEESLDHVPAFQKAKSDELVDTKAATIRLVGSEDPDILSDLDPAKLNRARLAQFRAAKRFYDDGIGRNQVHWTVAAAATPGWGQKVFPDLGPDEAEMRLWEEILKLVRADRPDCLEAWDEHNEKLHRRGKTLTELNISELVFRGPGTDLTVGLSKVAKFSGGTDIGPYGVPFEPNIPTEEVFTTPDWRATRGKARVTRPFLVNGKLIEGLEVEFEEGKVTRFEAKSGAETFGEYIKSDEGASRLGEVALVGVDSPVFQSGLVFQEILFDENAACHIAVGSAYKSCLVGGDSMTPEQLAEVGCNESSAHTDMMISDEHVDVLARTYSQEEVPLIEKGEWQI